MQVQDAHNTIFMTLPGQNLGVLRLFLIKTKNLKAQFVVGKW